MLHRTSTTLAGIGVVAAVAIGAIVVAGSHGTSRTASSTVSSTVVRSATATVGGKTETILMDSRGMPLYYYAADGPTQSLVSGSLAALWPPVTTTATPTARGLAGSLTLVRDAHG